jgi:hypothetical protein
MKDKLEVTEVTIEAIGAKQTKKPGSEQEPGSSTIKVHLPY